LHRNSLTVGTVALALVVASAAPAAPHGNPPKLPQKPPKSDTAECYSGAVRSKALWFRAADGKVLAGAVYGSGHRGVVLAPESRGSHCGWIPFARRLAAAGYRVLAFDTRGHGQSPSPGAASWTRIDRDVIGAVRKLHALGARSVVAAGASLGGAAVLVAGPALTGLVSGIIDFSGEPDLGPGAGAKAALPRIQAPLLVVAGRDDPYADEQTSKEVLDAAGSSDKQLLVYPGPWHGWELVRNAPTAAGARADIFRWLALHT